LELGRWASSARDLGIRPAVNTDSVQLLYRHNGTASEELLALQQVVLELVVLGRAFGATADKFCAARYNVCFPLGSATSMDLGRCPNCQFMHFQTAAFR